MWRLAICLLLGPCLFAGSALAQTRTIAAAGGWTAFSGTLPRSGRGTCGVDTRHAQTGRHFLIQYAAGDRSLTARVIRESWSIPEGTRIPIRLQIDNVAPWGATATGAGNELSWSIAGDALSQFEAAFRRGLQMRIEFLSGTERPWTFTLSGTNAVTSAFVECLRLLRGGPPAASGPTQPFDTAPPAPTQPFVGGPGRTPPGSSEGQPKPPIR